MTTANTPWYRQFWPWFLIALPGSVVVACIVTIIIAINNPDSLVRDNYYREGLAINQELALSETADRLGISAALAIDGDALRVTLNDGSTGVASPAQLNAVFIHPMDKQRDFALPLRRTPAGDYTGTVPRPVGGRWYVQLNAAQPEPWRIKGEIRLPGSGRFQLPN